MIFLCFYLINNEMKSPLSSSSVNSIVGFVSPVPWQEGHFSLVTIFISGLTRCRVICIRPNFVRGRILCFVLSFDITSFIFHISCCLFSFVCISIKSTTMIPPISLKPAAVCAISVAASMLTSSAFAS